MSQHNVWNFVPWRVPPCSTPDTLRPWRWVIWSKETKHQSEIWVSFRVAISHRLDGCLPNLKPISKHLISTQIHNAKNGGWFTSARHQSTSRFRYERVWAWHFFGLFLQRQSAVTFPYHTYPTFQFEYIDLMVNSISFMVSTKSKTIQQIALRRSWQ